jgi:hypothetical protein
VNASPSSTPWPVPGTGRAAAPATRGTRENLFDRRRVAVVRNLRIIARQPVTNGYQRAA